MINENSENLNSSPSRDRDPQAQSGSDHKIGLCFVDEFPSLLEALEQVTPVTKSQLKKLGEKRKMWESPVKAKSETRLSENVLNYLKVNPVCTNSKVKVLDEDDDFIIISKPYDCHSHPLRYSDTNNVLSCLRSQYKEKVLGVNSGQYDRGLVYRLDYETSGLLLYCKKEILYKELREEFSTLVKEKTYYAIVQGNFSSCSLTHKIVYTGVKNSKARAFDCSHNEGITASLEATRIGHNQDENLTLLKVDLKEGHRHQIRVQLAAEGCPILGDTLYGGRDAERLFLHCHSYFVKNKLFKDPNMEHFNLFFDLFSDSNS